MIWALHGTFGAPQDWAKLQQKGMNLRPIGLWEMARELRGGGGNGPGFEAWTEAFVEKVRNEDPTPSLMGYSLGGRLALHAILAAPRLWKSAIIVSAHPGLENENLRRARRASDAIWAKKLRDESLSAVLSEWEDQEAFKRSEKEIDFAHLGKYRDELTAAFEEWSLGRQAPLEERLGDVPCPVLWVTGIEDERFTRLAAGAVSRLPAGRHVVIEQCGHRVPWEKPDDFARTVLRFQNGVAMA